MARDRKLPDGLTALALLMVLAGIRAIWNLIYHSASVPGSLCEAALFLLLALGLALRYRIAFIAFVVYYVYLLALSILVLISPGSYSRAHIALGAGVKVALLLWIFCYRGHFFKGKHAPGSDDQAAKSDVDMARTQANP
jgi:hypothetical protein